MTDDEIMRQLSQAVRDDVLAAEEMVEVGQEQHPEWDWPFLATVLWIQRGQELEEPLRQPAWRRWLQRRAGRPAPGYRRPSRPPDRRPGAPAGHQAAGLPGPGRLNGRTGVPPGRAADC
jgi:hypothetical protein